MIISISGTSGAGKSSIIKELERSRLFPKKSIIVVKEDSFLIPRMIKKVFGESSFKHFNSTKLQDKKPIGLNSRVFHLLVSTLYPFIVVLEFYARYFIYKTFYRSHTVIYDRYSYDYYVTYKHNFKERSNFLQSIFFLAPRLDLSFLLRISVSDALLRNKNTIPGTITNTKRFQEAVINEYKLLSEKGEIIVVDSNVGVQESAEIVLEYIKRRQILDNVGSISFSGSDGTGKSTIARMFVEYAKTVGVGVSVVHFFHDNIVYKFLKRLGVVGIESEEIQIRENYKKSIERRKNLKKPFIWAFLHFTDSIIQYFFYRILYWNKLIIYDRYFYDFIVSFRYHKVANSQIFVNLIPRPTYSFLMIDEAKNVFKRKPENVIDFFQEINVLYKHASREFDLKSVKITNKKPQVVFEEVIKSI